MVKSVSVREYQEPKCTEREGDKPERQRYPEVKDKTKSHYLDEGGKLHRPREDN